MKKNFMAIASLLIAAMLLVVSCAPEANVEGKVEDNGLVNASLMATAAGKALTVSYPENEALSYTITLKAEWDPNSEANSDYRMDAVVGEKEIERSSISGTIDLGWISQGLWTVKVEGKRNGVTVVQGSTKKYITKNNEGVVVFLGTNTASEKTTNLGFDITVNELATNNDGYSLKATIERADKVNKTPSNPNLTLDPADNSVGNTRKYTGNTTLTPGYYKVTVQLIKTTPAASEGGEPTEDIIGGITRGVLVTGESTITIKGSVSASDFAEGSLFVYTPEVKIDSFTAVKDGTSNIITYNSENQASYDSENQRYKGTATDADGSYKIKYTVGASLNGVPSSGVTVNTTPTYTWIVDGKVVTTTNTEGEKEDYNDSFLEVEYSAPGDKNVTCIVTYACKAEIGLTKYSFTIGKEAVAYVQVKEESNQQ